MKNSEIYLKAADVIEARGLNQDGDYAKIDGDPATCPVCVIGAIRVVVDGDPNGRSVDAADAANDLADWLRETSRIPHGRLLPEWNDYDASAGKVIAALHEAAKAEAAAGR